MKSIIRQHDTTPANLRQAQTLRDVSEFLRHLLRDGQETMDPERLYVGVRRALGDEGSDHEILAQAAHPLNA